MSQILKIKSVENDFRTAILNSSNSYGIELFGEDSFNKKASFLSNVKEFYLVEITDIIEIYYITTFKNSINGKYRILHKFSWNSCLSGWSAAICNISSPDYNDFRVVSRREKRDVVFAGDLILIGEYKYDRDSLRGCNYFWTI